jgi:hypothetical protein
MRRAAKLCLPLMLCVAACSGGAGGPDASASASGSAELAPAPRLDPVPELSRQIVRKKGARDLVTAARVLVPHQTTLDPVGVALTWEDEGEKPLGSEHPLAAKRVDLDQLLETLTISVRGPSTSDPELRLRVAPQKQAPDYETQLSKASLVLRLDRVALRENLGRDAWRWETRPSALMSRPGTYTVKISGDLHDGTEAIPFETGELTVEVSARSDANLSMAEIERVASKEVSTRWRLDPPPPSKETVEDVAGNRVVRFVVDAPRTASKRRDEGESERDFIEIVVGRDGDVRNIASQRISTCVAEGTTVATPFGARAIETLSVGDQVWALEPGARTPKLVRVTGVHRAFSERVLQIAPGLRVTPEHPLFSEDRFVPAAELGEGDGLFTLGLTRYELLAHPRLTEPAWVFDLSVEWPHTFFAGGYLVHNKMGSSPIASAARGDSWSTLDLRPKP